MSASSTMVTPEPRSASRDGRGGTTRAGRGSAARRPGERAQEARRRLRIEDDRRLDGLDLAGAEPPEGARRGVRPTATGSSIRARLRAVEYQESRCISPFRPATGETLIPKVVVA